MPTVTKLSKADRDRAAFLDCVEDLTQQVEGWAKSLKWTVAREEKVLDESRLGTYSAPALSIRTPRGVIFLEPVGRDIARADGRVDLMAWPSMIRMMLIRSHDQWVPKTDSGVKWPGRWSKATFEQLAEEIQATD